MPNKTDDEKTKVTNFAVKAAKDAVILWAERFDDDDLRLQVAIAASLAVASHMIDAVMDLDEPEIEAATLDALERGMLPLIAKLRERVATQ